MKQRIRDNGMPPSVQLNPIYPNSFLHLLDSPLRHILASSYFRVGISLFYKAHFAVVFWLIALFRISIPF